MSPICDKQNADKLFIKSRWYESPPYFYDWANIIDTNNISVLTYIVENFTSAFTNSLFYGIYYTGKKLTVNENAGLIISDIINTIGYNAEILLDIKGKTKQYSFAMIYIYHTCWAAKPEINYKYVTKHRRIVSQSAYETGLYTLKKYISTSTKIEAYKHFKKIYDMYLNASQSTDTCNCQKDDAAWIVYFESAMNIMS